MITIPKFTEEQKIENLKKGIEALRKNRKKAVGAMKNDRGGRCCLCVLAHVAEDICGVERDTFVGTFMPSIDLREIFAIGSITFPENLVVNGQSLSSWNDGSIECKKTSHKKIADMLEKGYIS
jgi:hypothetical protein